VTAYADTAAAIASINEIGLDHYLLKPVHPRRSDCTRCSTTCSPSGPITRPTAVTRIRVAGAQWSRQCFEAKEFLARNHVPYQWLTSSATATRELVEAADGGLTRPAGDPLP